MKCSDARKLLHRRLEGVLDRRTASRLDAHLASCAGCRAELERAARYVKRMASLSPVRAPEDFLARVNARLSEGGETAGGRKAGSRSGGARARVADILFRPLKVKLPIEAAAAAAAALAVIAVLHLNRPPERAAFDTSRVSAGKPSADAMGPAQPSIPKDTSVPAEPHAPTGSPERGPAPMTERLAPAKDEAEPAAASAPSPPAPMEEEEAPRGMSTDIAKETRAPVPPVSDSGEQADMEMEKELPRTVVLLLTTPLPAPDLPPAGRRRAKAVRPTGGDEAAGMVEEVSEIILDEGGSITELIQPGEGPRRATIRARIPEDALVRIVDRLKAFGRVEKQAAATVEQAPPSRSAESYAPISLAVELTVDAHR